MALEASNCTRTLTASDAAASGRWPLVCWGSRAGTERTVVSVSLSLLPLAAASVRRDSVSTEEMFSLSSTPAKALPLVYHRGLLLHAPSQEKALVPVSKASTARRE